MTSAVQIKTDEQLDTLAVFSALNNETRQRVLHLLAVNGELCVCEVVSALDIAQPAASKALNNLKNAGLLSTRRDANWTYYRIGRPQPKWLAQIIRATVARLEDWPVCQADQTRFRQSASVCN